MLQSRRVRYALLGACLALLIPTTALAQEGTIAGTVRDEQGGAMPGVTIEATGPALIGTRTTTSDDRGQYRITNLPVGTYTVVFTLSGFQRQQRDNVVLTSGFTANVSPALRVGNFQETVAVTADPPVVDVQNARQAITFSGDQLQELPTARNINSLLALTPGIGSAYRPGTAYGICSGGVGTFCNPGIQGFDQGEELGGSLLASQGQVKVDGMVINSNASLTQSVAGGPIVGMLGGYMADIANAQEISIQLSGALGESETGGATINIVPRTGGNRFAGNFNTTYTRNSWFAKNDGAYENININNLVQYNYDVSGAYGGPILRDRLWFHSVARDQGKKQFPGGGEFFPNLHEGKWGYNYQPDRPAGVLSYTNRWRNANARFTWQATEKNKFNIFWDEQNFCQDPCHGMVATFVAPEAWWSVQVQPNRLQQLSWTNPLTSRILLESRMSITTQDNRTDRHLQYRNPREIPRVAETGTTAGGDAVATRVNNFAGLGGPFALQSGSLNTDLTSPGSRAQRIDSDNYRMNASAAYVTGTHNFKVGYDGAIISQAVFNQANDPRMTYNYTQPTTTVCNPFVNPALTACGNTHLGNQFVGPQFDTFEEQNNYYRRPRPSSVVINTGAGKVAERLNTHAFFAQDQWTFKRLTLSGALRYDRATSHYGSTCVGPDVFVPADLAFCTGEHDGVSFNDVSPRWGVVYDLFGTGRTAIKFNYGKYLGQAALTGVYANANPARRTVNSVTVNWDDLNGNRIVDCDIAGMLEAARSRHANGITNPNTVSGGPECASFTAGSETQRFGRNPFVLDAEGSLPGLGLTQCGLTFGVRPEVLDYCAAYGESLIDGWGRRDYRWQSGLGIQHELLPRLSVEVTWNRRRTSNVMVTDRLNQGCDRFLAGTDVRTCNEMFLNYTHPDYHFYSYVAPQDPRLPGGGGYRVTGLNTGNNAQTATGPQVQTFMEERKSTWHGIDTNFVWRGPRGLRLNGGTSSGYSNLNTCYAELDNPNVRGRDGDYRGGCDSLSPWNTRINGTVSFVIPWVDVLTSGVFQGFRGVSRSANVQDVHKSQVQWEPGSVSRLNDACRAPVAVEGTGCFGVDRNTATQDINVLMPNELFGERIMLFDLKLAKNIRFAGRRLTVGVDVFNVLNSDAITGYNNTYILPQDLEEGDVNPWGEPTSLVSPRFAQFSLQFDF
jgi:hypothetical protein